MRYQRIKPLPKQRLIDLATYKLEHEWGYFKNTFAEYITGDIHPLHCWVKAILTNEEFVLLINSKTISIYPLNGELYVTW